MITELIKQLWASPKVKIIAVVGIVTGLLFIGRWHGNRQWTAGEREGRQNVAAQITKEKEAEWAAREEEITALEAQASQRLDDLTQASNAVNAARATLIKNFDITLKELEADRVESYRYAGAVADADLISELRAISGRLATAGRADGSGTPPDTRTAP